MKYNAWLVGCEELGRLVVGTWGLGTGCLYSYVYFHVACVSTFEKLFVETHEATRPTREDNCSRGTVED